MTTLESKDQIVREIPSQRYRFTDRASDHYRALVVTVDAYGVKVRGKGLSSSEASIGWSNLIYYARRESKKRKPTSSEHRNAARWDAQRAIRAAFPDRAEEIIGLLGLD